jgi:predicted HicB family RNase H-like nuclease
METMTRTPGGTVANESAASVDGRTQTKSVLVKMPSKIKRPLVRAAGKQKASLNDVAVTILAENLDFEFVPSDRFPASKPDPTVEDVVLRIPADGKKKIQVAALEAGLNMTDFVNNELAKHFSVKFTPAGRERVPYGGGSRQPKS